MDLERHQKARLFAAVARIQDHDLYNEAQSVVAQSRDVPDTLRLIEIIEFMARHENAMADVVTELRSVNAEVSERLRGAAAALGPDADYMIDDALTFSNKATRTSAAAAQVTRDAVLLIYSMAERDERLQSIADALNKLGHCTARGKKWTPVQVSRVIAKGGGLIVRRDGRFTKTSPECGT